jgi:hypothetical protein
VVMPVAGCFKGLSGRVLDIGVTQERLHLGTLRPWWYLGRRLPVLGVGGRHRDVLSRSVAILPRGGWWEWTVYQSDLLQPGRSTNGHRPPPPLLAPRESGGFCGTPAVLVTIDFEDDPKSGRNLDPQLSHTFRCPKASSAGTHSPIGPTCDDASKRPLTC